MINTMEGKLPDVMMEQQPSTYQMMLNSIASDLDLLLDDLCQIYPAKDQRETKFQTFGKGQSCDSSQAIGEDSAFGTLASTDSIVREERSDSIRSGHLDVFRLQDQGLEIPTAISETPPTRPERCMSDTHLAAEQRNISFLERLSKTHPIWYLPDIGRSGAVHLLKDREPGTFIVRNSSQPNTLALSAQFPEKGRANVDHYLIQQCQQGFQVHGSLHFFSSIPDLINHYHQHQGELPCRLLLPPTIRRANTLQELTSLSYLGQDFWTSYKFDRGSQINLAPLGINLHKSKSEPINITQASHFIISNPSISRRMPPCSSHLSSSHTTESLGRSSHSNSSRGSHQSLQQSHSSVEEGQLIKAVDKTHIRTSREGSSAESLLSSDNNSAGSGHVKNANANLYGMTSLDLLNIPEETQYFKSNLSDKMSDYEDIWRHSIPNQNVYVPSPIPVIPKQKPSPVVPVVPRKKASKKSFNKENVQDPHVEQTCDNLSEFHASKPIPEKEIHNDLNSSTLPSTTPKSNIHRTLSLEDYKIKNAVRSTDSLNVKVTSSVQTQTSPKMKSKPSPLPPVTDISQPKVVAPHSAGDDSSSTSTVLSSLKSPVYAEPFDTLNMVKDRKLRRRSAPSMGLHKRKLRAVSHIPVLETITSPGFDSECQNMFSENGDHGAKKVTFSATSQSLCLRRTQSDRVRYRTDPDEVHIDRKVLEKWKSENSQRMSKDPTHNHNSSLSWEELTEDQQNKVTSTLRKFPVYKRKVSNDSNSTEDSATMEDMISTINPTLTVRPVQFLNPTHPQGQSEYDNLTNQYGAASRRSHVSTGTEFCKPWDSVPIEALISQQNPKLAPPMDVTERIRAWQEARPERDSFFSEMTTDSDSDDSCLDTPKVVIHPPSSEGSLKNEPPDFTSKLCNEFFPSKKKPVDKTKLQFQEVSRLPHRAVLDNRLSIHSNGGFRDGASSLNLKQKEDSLEIDTAEDDDSRIKHKTPDSKIIEFICRMSTDRKTTFGSTIENFIQCTLESQETNPHHVTRNVRQFMTGIRNYLVKHGEGQLEDIIEKERSRLQPDEILNIDAIIERSLHICVLRPLKLHIYNLFVDEYTKNGSLVTLSSNIRYARTKSAQDLGVKFGISMPDAVTMDTIKGHLHNMQKACSPLKKLECLLCATSTIYKCMTKDLNQKDGIITIGADDFLPMLIYVLVHCGMVAAEIEADYMWGLVHPSVLSGEGGYYLTSLSSAVLALKNFQDMQKTNTDRQMSQLPSIGDMQGFLRIAIPDELRDTIVWKTLPVRPNMNTRDVCSMIAHKFRITNPHDYGLYLLVNGEESRLGDLVCPQTVKAEHQDLGSETVFAYKRNAAIIAWPVSVKKNSPQTVR